MFALISRILNLSGRYKSRIQAAFLCAFVESILSKMPIFMAFIVLAGFADNTLTGKTCLFVGLGLLAVVVVQTVVHYLSDRLQSAAGFMIFADKRMELGNHLRKCRWVTLHRGILAKSALFSVRIWFSLRKFL